MQNVQAFSTRVTKDFTKMQDSYQDFQKVLDWDLKQWLGVKCRSFVSFEEGTKLPLSPFLLGLVF